MGYPKYPDGGLRMEGVPSHHKTPRMSAYNIHWLERFSRRQSEFVGYAVSLDLAARGWRLRAARVYDGHTEQAWLNL